MLWKKREVNQDISFIRKQLIGAMLHKDGGGYIKAIILLNGIEQKLKHDK